MSVVRLKFKSLELVIRDKRWSREERVNKVVVVKVKVLEKIPETLRIGHRKERFERYVITQVSK